MLEPDSPHFPEGPCTTYSPTSREEFGLGRAGLSPFVGLLFQGPSLSLAGWGHTQPPSCQSRGPSRHAALPRTPHLPSVTSGVYTCPECAPLTVGSVQGPLGGWVLGICATPQPQPGWEEWVGGWGGAVRVTHGCSCPPPRPPCPPSALLHQPSSRWSLPGRPCFTTRGPSPDPIHGCPWPPLPAAPRGAGCRWLYTPEASQAFLSVSRVEWTVAPCSQACRPHPGPWPPTTQLTAPWLLGPTSALGLAIVQKEEECPPPRSDASQAPRQGSVPWKGRWVPEKAAVGSVRTHRQGCCQDNYLRTLRCEFHTI